MITKICQKCDTEMRLIPAGVSKKTNKPYSAFWTCDSRNGGCGATARADSEAESQPQSFGEPYREKPGTDRLTVIEQKLDQIIELLQSR